MRIAILQRVIPFYRLGLFRALVKEPHHSFRIFIGDDLPNSKVRSASRLDGICPVRLPTRFIRFGRRTFPLHKGLCRELARFAPDVIICEGESHLLGYLQAMWYRATTRRRVALVHWCFTSLPGEKRRAYGFAQCVKRMLKRHFDAYLLYSSFSLDRLVEQGVERERAFVATNVGDVSPLISRNLPSCDERISIRHRLGFADRFTVLYSGTLDDNKRPEILLDLAIGFGESISFVVIGDGPLKSALEERAHALKLGNISFRGRINTGIVEYYTAADVLLVPGRGGIVISEAMALALPVIVHEADGTEYDLVVDGVTGIRVPSGDTSSFESAVRFLSSNPYKAREMGLAARRLIVTRYGTDNMVRVINNCAEYALTRANKRT